MSIFISYWSIVFLFCDVLYGFIIRIILGLHNGLEIPSYVNIVLCGLGPLKNLGRKWTGSNLINTHGKLNGSKADEGLMLLSGGLSVCVKHGRLYSESQQRRLLGGIFLF